MPRIRIEFLKGEQVRFLSHLDIVKAFERAIRRAELPIAFSEGFNPHPKMNFASALAVGVTSDREYMDIDLKTDLPANDVVFRLSEALPPGIEIKMAREVDDKAPSLMAEVNRAIYTVAVPLNGTIEAGMLELQVGKFLATDEIMIRKWTKKGTRDKNIRPGIIVFQGNLVDGVVEFSVLTAMTNEGNVRPEEAVKAFIEKSALPLDQDSLYIKRHALYVEKDGEMLNPIDLHLVSAGR